MIKSEFAALCGISDSAIIAYTRDKKLDLGDASRNFAFFVAMRMKQVFRTRVKTVMPIFEMLAEHDIMRWENEFVVLENGEAFLAVETEAVRCLNLAELRREFIHVGCGLGRRPKKARRKVRLVDVPEGLDISELERRDGVVVDMTGKRKNGRVVKGLLGFTDSTSVWLVECSCGRFYASHGGNVARLLDRPCVHMAWLTSFSKRKDVCQAWKDPVVVDEAVGTRPKGMSLFKIDHSKPFGPGNWVWKEG